MVIGGSIYDIVTKAHSDLLKVRALFTTYFLASIGSVCRALRLLCNLSLSPSHFLIFELAFLGAQRHTLCTALSFVTAIQGLYGIHTGHTLLPGAHRARQARRHRTLIRESSIIDYRKLSTLFAYHSHSLPLTLTLSSTFSPSLSFSPSPPPGRAGPSAVAVCARF